MSISVALSQHFESFIREQLENGHFNSASEVVSAGLKLLEEHEQQRMSQLEALRADIQAGMASEERKPAEEVFDRLEAKYAGLTSAR